MMFEAVMVLNGLRLAKVVVMVAETETLNGLVIGLVPLVGPGVEIVQLMEW